MKLSLHGVHINRLNAGTLLRRWLEATSISSQTQIEGGFVRYSHTRAEVHRNQVEDQVGIQNQAYQEGNLEVGSLVGVLAYQGGLSRSRQGDLTAG